MIEQAELNTHRWSYMAGQVRLSTTRPMRNIASAKTASEAAYEILK
jgi:hypothetical protein